MRIGPANNMPQAMKGGEGRASQIESQIELLQEQMKQVQEDRFISKEKKDDKIKELKEKIEGLKEELSKVKRDTGNNDLKTEGNNQRTESPAAVVDISAEGKKLNASGSGSLANDQIIGQGALRNHSRAEEAEMSKAYETEFIKAMGPISNKVNLSENMDSLAQKYEDMYKDLKENHSGNELDRRLDMLDRAYDKSVSNVSSWQKTLINSNALIHNIKDRVQGEEQGRYENIREGLDELTDNVTAGIIKHGADAKDYIKDGGSLADKDDFNAYINKNSGPYSISKINIVNEMLGITDRKNDEQKKLEDFGFSKAVEDTLNYLTRV